MTSALVGSPVLPATGQLVQVRGRYWVVTDVAPTALPFDVTTVNPGEGQTLVTLSSVEDDGLGEELRVLWELEPGRRVLESATLPDLSAGRFDDPATLGAFLDALRWGAVTNAETTVLQAPFRAGIAIDDTSTALVTSANLTRRATGDNLEIGVLLRGQDIPSRLVAHIAELTQVGVLQEAGA